MVEDKTLTHGHSGFKAYAIQQTLICLLPLCVHRWEELNSLAEQRRKLLAGAEQVHRFVRDAVETNDRMNEKV